MTSNVADIALVMNELKLPSDSPQTSSSNALIARAQAGEAAAFEQLMLHHQQRTVTLAWRLLGDREDARDAAQEAFLRVYKHLGKFDLKQDFAGWLYRIVVNVCRDAAQRRCRRAEDSLESEAAGSVMALPNGEDAEAAAIRAQQQALVLKALSSLTEKERAALVLRDLEGLPTEEVARILGSSAATVRSQISAARHKIKLFHARLLKQPGGAR